MSVNGDCYTPLTACGVMPSALAHSPENNASHPISETGFASTGFLIVCSALVFLMTPAVGLLYSGFSRSQHALTIVLICCLSYTVVSVQWVLWGFSLCFSETSHSPFIGNLAYVGLDAVTWQGLPLTAPAVPAIAFALYEMQFAAVTLALIFGSVIERVRVAPTVLFMFIWTTVIYDPIVYWTWGARGWIRNLSCLDTLGVDDTPCRIGGLDYAGGGPVHITAGAAALAFCVFIGRRRPAFANAANVAAATAANAAAPTRLTAQALMHTAGSGASAASGTGSGSGGPEFRPHSVSNIFLGTALLWMGWFGFNGGSTLTATSRAALAALNTTIAASTGAIAWTAVDYFFHSKKFSGVAFCSGAIAGMVGTTPNAGFVTPWCALFIGAITSVCCAFAVRVKGHFGYDDSADAWGIHGIGGFVGNILTGFFAKSAVALLDGTVIPGGLLFDGSGYLLGYNIAASFAILGYSYIGTYLILVLLSRFPGLDFRLDLDEELKGSDWTNMGEGVASVAARARRRASQSDSSSTLQHALAAASSHGGAGGLAPVGDIILDLHTAANTLSNTHIGARKWSSAIDVESEAAESPARKPCLQSAVLRAILHERDNGTAAGGATGLVPFSSPPPPPPCHTQLQQQQQQQQPQQGQLASPVGKGGRRPATSTLVPNPNKAEPNYAGGASANVIDLGSKQNAASVLRQRGPPMASDIDDELHHLELQLEVLRLQQQKNQLRQQRQLSQNQQQPQWQPVGSFTSEGSGSSRNGVLNQTTTNNYNYSNDRPNNYPDRTQIQVEIDQAALEASAKAALLAAAAANPSVTAAYSDTAISMV